MRQSIGALGALCTAALLLTACNGANSTTPPGTGMTCGGPPSVNQLEVIYPIPGTKKAPDNLTTIYVATKGTLPPNNSFDFLLTQSNGTSTFTGPFVTVNASQIPTPHKNPSYANPTYYATSVSGPSGGYIIGPAQAVNLYWNDGGTGCTPHFLVSSFSTQ